MPRITAAERKRQEAEARDRAIHAALAWPLEPCPQPWSKEAVYEAGWTVSGSRENPIRAWTYNAYSLRVTYGSFDPYAHSPDDDKPRSKGQGGSWFAYAGKHIIGMVVPLSDDRGVDWRISAITWSKYLSPTAGECATVDKAKRAFRRAWRKWLAERGLAEVDGAFA